MRILDISQQIAVVGYAVPIVCGVICMLVVILFLIQSREDRKPGLLLLGELAACVFSWVGVIAYTISPETFMAVKTPFLLSITWVHVLTYHFVFTLTGTQSGECFSPVHYIVPLIIVTATFVWAIWIPYDVKLGLTIASEAPPESYKLFAVFYNSPRFLFPVYGILYAVLGFRRINSFEKVLLNYSADEGNSSVKWLRMMVIVTLTTVPLSAVPVLTGTNKLASSIILLIPTLLIVLKDVILTYNTVVRHYVLIEIPEGEDELTYDDDWGKMKPGKEKLDQYMLSQKPFLDPKLKITGLAQQMHTNRTYLSNFINREYGMNFNRFINRYRLRELDELRTKPALNGMSNMELVQKTGFSTFSGYLRAKRLEEKMNTLSDDD